MLALAALLVAAPPERDAHSFFTPDDIRVKHLDLDLAVDFDRKQLRGTVTLRLQRPSGGGRPLTLDTRDLHIEAVAASRDGTAFAPTAFELGKPDPVLGRPLVVTLPAGTTAVRVTYHTGPSATALQWLAPAQTAGKRHPMLFTQSQAIDARSWLPCQDSPGVRVTYTARVRCPAGLRAVMSAGNDPQAPAAGEFRFAMTEPIPSYLIALAVGDLQFKAVGPRTGVYAEPPVVSKAAAEFADLEDMLTACERLYGPYRWGRYDVLVMPPSFPFGGMENPRLTFASPTVLAGDKSLVAVLAHELAHSWSGNLVSNATWRDFWLNEGFTVYLERRIMEAVYGRERAAVEAVIGRRELERELADLPKPDQVLHVDLAGRSPTDGLTGVPYEKGNLFLQHLEGVYGRERFDAFLKGYFAHFAFQSITTAEFRAYLEQHLLAGDPEKAKRAKVAEWLTAPGLPADAPKPAAPALVAVADAAERFTAGGPAAGLPGKRWTTQEWLHFLDALPADLPASKLADLDAAFALTRSGNSEVLFQWLLLAVRRGYEPAYDRLAGFLTEQGRRKFLKPLYEELAKTPAGKERARAIYRDARPTYHPLSAETVDAILGWGDKR